MTFGVSCKNPGFELKAHHKIFCFLTDKSKRFELKEKLHLYIEKVQIIQVYYKRNTKFKVHHKIKFLDLYWSRIVADLGSLDSMTKFRKY